MPSRTSSVSVISATSTSISTWRGMRSSCLIVFSISVQLLGNVVTITELVTSSAMKRTWPSARYVGRVRAARGRDPWSREDRRRRGRRRTRPRGRRGRLARRGRGGPAVARAIDRVQGRREVLRFGVLGVVDEHASAAVDIDVELRGPTPDRLDLVLSWRARSASSTGARAGSAARARPRPLGWPGAARRERRHAGRPRATTLRGSRRRARRRRADPARWRRAGSGSSPARRRRHTRSE